MTRRRPLGLSLLMSLAMFALPRAAEAQEWLKDRQNTEGSGWQLGDVEFHLGFGAEGGYDSNYFIRSLKTGADIANGAPGAPVLGAGILRLTGSLGVGTLGPQRRTDGQTPGFTFRFDTNVSYQELFGDPSLTTQRNVAGAAKFRGDINPGQPFSVGFQAAYARTIQPNVNADPNLSFNRSDVSGGLDFRIMPGGGLLDWNFGYQLRASLFEETGTGAYTSLTHEASTKGRWRFGPKTALVHDTTWRYLSYPLSSDLAGTLREAMPLRTRVGLSGLVTHRLGVVAMAGYGGSFFDSSRNPQAKQYDSVIGMAELTYHLTPTPTDDSPGQLTLQMSHVALGYERDFQASLLSDYFGQDRAYSRFSYYFAGVAMINVGAGFSIMKYPPLFYNDAQPKHSAFTDYRVDASVYGEYRFADWFAIGATVKYMRNISKARIPVEGAGATFVDMNFQRLESYLALRLFK